jgi:hypothetical protein
VFLEPPEVVVGEEGVVGEEVRERVDAEDDGFGDGGGLRGDSGGHGATLDWLVPVFTATTRRRQPRQPTAQ